MPNAFDFGNIWKILREVDLGPIRAEAERMTWVAIVGADANARRELAHALSVEARKQLPQNDASRYGPEPLEVGLENAPREMTADLIVLLVNLSTGDTSQEWELFQAWHTAGKKIVVLFSGQGTPVGFGGAWQGARGLRGLPTDRLFLETEFASAVLELLPDRHLSLARYYPVFRRRVAQELISSTSLANANYSLTTGLAEVIPVLDIPFNVADMIILTKNQAIMVYKLGLIFGLPARWQEHMTAFGGTVGTSFLWRQLARQLVGLVPVWGIIPKVAVAYAGTFVLGQAIEQWYVTGHQATPEMMRQFYRQAFEQGKGLARALVNRMPRRRPTFSLPSLRRFRLPALRLPQLPSIGRKPKRMELPARTMIQCPNCNAENPSGNQYCGSCGAKL
ncbi:MAG: zinc-ribbon domain-containing protein [Anaerolineae bacterium]